MKNFVFHLKYQYINVLMKSRHKTKISDYVIIISGNVIIVEVKQIDFSPTEKKHLERYLSEGSTGIISDVPGKRLRKVISKAMPQLKSTSHGKHPAILVVYDNTMQMFDKTNPYEVLSAMYGLEQVVFTIPNSVDMDPRIVDHKFGPDRKVSPSQNKTLSAVVMLSLDKDNSKKFKIFSTILIL